MAKLSKNRKNSIDKVDLDSTYSTLDAAKLVKETSSEKFDASVDIAIKLGVDPKQANQMVRGVVALPHGTGKSLKVLALVTADKEEEAKEAGADFVGLDEYVEKIKGGWTDIDVIVSTPDMMAEVGKLGRVLGPRGLMPNPKSGTVTNDISKAVNDLKAGKIEFRVEKEGIIHVGIGKISFDENQIIENFNTFMDAIIKARPNTLKVKYIKKVSLSSTMSPGFKLNIEHH